MVSMSLEERGVYNTIIDLLYLTWRPIEDDRGYIAGHCRCAVQKLNPILGRLIESGKLIRFTEGGRDYISNGMFEDERSEVKGEVSTRSGRAKVREKSAGVEEKSAGVRDNCTLLDTDSAKNQSLTGLERQDKSRVESPQPPNGGGPQEAFELWNDLAGRCDLPIAKTLSDARRRAIAKRLSEVGIAGWREALAAVEASAFLRGQIKGREFKADLDFVCQAKSFHRLRDGSYGQDARPAQPPAQPSDPLAPWRRRVRAFKAEKHWNRSEWDGPPGSPDCIVPAEVLLEFGYEPTGDQGELIQFRTAGKGAA